MKTRNETYGSQTKRESKSILKKINGCNSSKTRYAGKDAEKSSLHGPSAIGKTSVRNETMQMNMASLNVRILTSEMVKNSALTASLIEGKLIDQIGGKVESRERKMKNVLDQHLDELNKNMVQLTSTDEQLELFDQKLKQFSRHKRY